MCGHLLLLLLAVLQVCSATENYVRPTEPTDTTCPGQPCLTLNEYTNDKSHYIKSNTVFIFLSGQHHMDRPLERIDMQNVTLKSTSTENIQPVLVPRFPCEVHSHCLELFNISSDEGYDYDYDYDYDFDYDYDPLSDYRFYHGILFVCCSTVHLINVSHADIDGIQIAANSPNASALIIDNGTDIQIFNIVITANKESSSVTGTLIYKSSRILVDSLQATTSHSELQQPILFL